MDKHLAIKRSKGLEEVIYKGRTISVIMRSSYVPDEVCFLSQPAFSQQLGYLPHKKGKVIKAHFHKVVHRKITRTQEVLFIRKGKVKVNFYTAGKEYLSSSTLNDGDVIFLCSGGHGFEILKDAQIIEVKQGPYSGKDSDKTVFKGIEKE